VLEKEGFRYRNYIDIFDGGPTLECDIDRVRAIRKSRLVTVAEGQPAPGNGRYAWWPTSSICSFARCWCTPIRIPNAWC
jgi:arginine/ornithine N-succinyltransferase beta subunit